VPTLWPGSSIFSTPIPLAVPDLERVDRWPTCPEAMMRTFIEQHGTDVIHAWGMTEMSPIGRSARRAAANSLQRSERGLGLSRAGAMGPG
jgi:fatty-acyl-CoA synthase